MTALGNVCYQTLDLIFYTYHNSTTRSFILILVLDDDMRHLSAHFSASPWLHPCVERHDCKFWADFPSTIYLLLSESRKTEILQILSRTFPTISVLLAKKGKKRIANFWQNFFPPSTFSLQHCHQRSWYLGKQWNEGKGIQRKLLEQN